jgi:hypothetical protein
MTNKKFTDDDRTNQRGMKVRMLDMAAAWRRMAVFCVIDGNESNFKRCIGRARQYVASAKYHNQPLP